MEQVRTVPICLFDGTFVGGGEKSVNNQEKEEQGRKEEKKSFDVSSRQYEHNSTSSSKKCLTEKTFVPIKIHVEKKIDESTLGKLKFPDKVQENIKENVNSISGEERKMTSCVTSSQSRSKSSISNHIPEWKSFSTFPRHTLNRHGNANELQKRTGLSESASEKKTVAKENNIEIKLSGPIDNINEEGTNGQMEKEELPSKFYNSTSSIPSLFNIEVPSVLGGATSCPDRLHEKPKTLNQINSELLEAQRQLSGQLEDLEERKTGKFPAHEKEMRNGTVKVTDASPIKEQTEKDNLTNKTPRSLSPEKPNPLSSPQLERYMEVWENISKDINEIKQKPERQSNSPRDVKEEEVPPQETLEACAEHSPSIAINLAPQTEDIESKDKYIPDRPGRLKICHKQPAGKKDEYDTDRRENANKDVYDTDRREDDKREEYDIDRREDANKDEYDTDRREDGKKEEYNTDTKGDEELCETESLEEDDLADMGTDYACYACDACTQTDPVVIVDRDKNCVVM